MGDDADAWKKLASRKGPLERYAEREARKVSRVLDLPAVKKVLLTIEVKLAILRALKYGQKQPGMR